MAWGGRFEREQRSSLSARAAFNNKAGWWCDFTSKSHIDRAVLPTKVPEFLGGCGCGWVCLVVTDQITTDEDYLVTIGKGIKLPRKWERYQGTTRVYAEDVYWVEYQGRYCADTTLKKAVTKMDKMIQKEIFSRLG